LVKGVISVTMWSLYFLLFLILSLIFCHFLSFLFFRHDKKLQKRYWMPIFNFLLVLEFVGLLCMPKDIKNFFIGNLFLGSNSIWIASAWPVLTRTNFFIAWIGNCSSCDILVKTDNYTFKSLKIASVPKYILQQGSNYPHFIN